MNYRNLSRRFARVSAVGGVFATLSLVMGLSGEVRADVPDGPARVGEIILKVAPGMTDADAKSLAAKVNFEVSGPIPYAPGYYRLVQKTRSVEPPAPLVSRKGRAVTTVLPVVHFSAEFKNAVETLRAVPGVLADPNYIYPLHRMRQQQDTSVPNDPYYPAGNIISSAGQAWHYGLVNMPQAWAVQSNGAGRTILAGVIDSGIDPGHPDLVNRISPLSRDFATRDADGNIVPSATLLDNLGHGTHTGGTVGAETNNSVGVAGIGGWNKDGVDIKIVAMRAGDEGIFTDSQIAAYGYCLANNIDVVNMSYGGTTPSTTVESAIAAAYKAGTTFVASAGNDGLDDSGNPDPVRGQTPNYPASYPEVINVSAVGPERTLAVYSSYGSNVAITAPGGSDITFSNPARMVISTYPRNHKSAYPDTAPSPVDGYSSDQGTSMAAPHVSGAVALMLACGAPRDPVTIKQILQSTAQVQADEAPRASGGKYGAGLLDVYQAILPYANPPFFATIPNTTPASVSQGVTTAAIAAQVGDLPFSDRGVSYAATQAPLTIQVRGVARKAATDVLTVELQTATTPSTTLRTFTAGDSGANGFDIPTLSTGQAKGTSFSVQVPRDSTTNPITVPDGRYRFALKLNGVTQAYTFFEKVSRSQPLGRALFSTPFQVRQVDSNTPEQTLFGTGTSFSLARYNPLRLPSDFDYALFQSGSGGRSDTAASFNASALNGLPLSFDTSNPSVSVAPVGLGYWLKLDSAVVLNSSGSVVTNPVGVRCYAANGGWNMIGAPFTFPVAWGGTTVVASNGQTYSLTEAIAAGIVSSALVSFVNNDYQYDIAPGGTLMPFNGYWVRVFQDCTLIIAPSGSATASGRAVGAKVPVASAAAASPLASGWKVRLAASVDGDRDGQNFFGQVRSSASKTRVSLPKPPSGAGHAYLRFVDADDSGRAAAKSGAVNSGPMAYDLRLATSGSEGSSRESWTAQVSTDKPDADVTLAWDGLGTAPRRAGLYLTDTVTGKKVSLRDRSSYTYKSGAAGSTRAFTISMEPTRTAGPLAIRNVTVSPIGRAMGGGIAVRFSTTRDGDVTGVVRTLSGQVVSVLGGTSRATAATTTQMVWTGRATNGAALPAGAYQLEIAVRDADGNTATVKQTVQSAR